MASLIPGFNRADTVTNPISGNRAFRQSGVVSSITMNPPSPQVAGYGAIYTDGFTTPDLLTDASMRAPFAAYASPAIGADVTTVGTNTDACWGGQGASQDGIV